MSIGDDSPIDLSFPAGWKQPALQVESEMLAERSTTGAERLDCWALRLELRSDNVRTGRDGSWVERVATLRDVAGKLRAHAERIRSVPSGRLLLTADECAVLPAGSAVVRTLVDGEMMSETTALLRLPEGWTSATMLHVEPVEGETYLLLHVGAS